MILQGAIFGCTSIEKYLKALLVYFGDKRKYGHNIIKLYNAIKIKDLHLYKSLDHAFMQLLEQCYNFRYFDNISINESFTIKKKEFLAGLDTSFIHLISRLEKHRKETEFHVDLKLKNNTLWKNNIYCIKSNNMKTLIFLFMFIPACVMGQKYSTLEITPKPKMVGQSWREIKVITPKVPDSCTTISSALNYSAWQFY